MRGQSPTPGRIKNAGLTGSLILGNYHIDNRPTHLPPRCDEEIRTNMTYAGRTYTQRCVVRNDPCEGNESGACFQTDHGDTTQMIEHMKDENRRGA